MGRAHGQSWGVVDDGSHTCDGAGGESKAPPLIHDQVQGLSQRNDKGEGRYSILELEGG